MTTGLIGARPGRYDIEQRLPGGKAAAVFDQHRLPFVASTRRNGSDAVDPSSFKFRHRQAARVSHGLREARPHRPGRVAHLPRLHELWRRQPGQITPGRSARRRASLSGRFQVHLSTCSTVSEDKETPRSRTPFAQEREVRAARCRAVRVRFAS